MKNKLIFLMLIIILSNCAFSQKKTKQKDTLIHKTKEIIISATRYPEDLIEVPLSVSIIEKSQITDSKGYGFEDALRTAPGVLVQSRFGNQDARITIRGFGARGAGDRSNAGTSRGIRILLDGFPETEPDGRTAFDNIDLVLTEKMEIIRSNASAIWGNAAGGVINISTIPIINEPFVNFSAMGGSYGFKKFTLQSGSNLNNGKIWATVSSSGFDGYREHSSSDRLIANVGIQSNLSENTLMNVFLTGASNKFNIPGPLSETQYETDPSMANQTYLSRDEHRFNRLGRIGVSLDHNFDNNNSISASGYINPKYLERSERNTFREFTRFHLGGGLNYHNNYNISSNIKNKFLIGIDEQFQDGAILFYYLTNAQKDSLKTNKREGANSFGAYAQDEIIISDKLTFLLGVRYDNISYYSHDDIEDAVPTDPNLRYQEKSYTQVTPKAGITYRFSNEHSVFANYGGGVEAPAGNETDPPKDYQGNYLINPLLDPIKSSTIEIGTKNFMNFNNSFIKGLNYDAALFYISVTNDIIPYDGGKFYTTAGKTNRIGGELGLNLTMDYGFSLFSSITYMNSKYDDYSIDSALINSKYSGIADYKDKKAAGIPDLYYYAGIKYTADYLYGVYAEFNAQGISNYFVDDANTIEVPAYTIFNLTLGMTEPIKITNSMNIRAFFAINNLLDEKYAASAFINPDFDKKLSSYLYLEPGLPRNFTVGISVGFGNN